MSSPLSPSVEAMRRRVEGWRAAERRERILRSEEGALEPAAALRAAFELYDLFPTGSMPPDYLRSREVEDARDAWHRLRARLACPPSGAKLP